MESPCVKECKLVNDKCSGCGRTKEQIINWSKYTDEQRSKIMSWLFVSYENSDRKHVREFLSFDSEKEAREYQIEDLQCYGCGSYDIFEADEGEKND